MEGKVETYTDDGDRYFQWSMLVISRNEVKCVIPMPSLFFIESVTRGLRASYITIIIVIIII